MDRMSRRSFALLLLAYVVLRAIPVLACADVFGYDEEFAKAAAGKAVFDGVPAPWTSLAYGPHEGGGFVVSLLDALLFSLIGPSVLAVKLVAIGCGAALFAAILHLARAHFGARAAWFMAVCMLLAPEPFVRFSLLALGTHWEASFFVALLFALSLSIIGVDEMRGWRFGLLGLCAGFGLYFSLQMVAAIFTVAVFFVWRGRHLLRPRAVVLAAIGFAVGSLPLWLQVAAHGTSAISVRGQVSPGGGIGTIATIESLIAPVVDAHDPLVWLHALLFALAVCLAPWRERAVQLVGAYVLVFVLACVTSGLAIPFDPEHPAAWLQILRLSPAWMFLTLLACAGCARAWTSGGWRRASSVAAIGVAALAGARDLVTLTSTGRFEAGNVFFLAHAKGCVWVEYFDRLAPRVPGDLGHKAAVLMSVRDDPRDVAPSAAHSMFDAVHASDPEALDSVHAAFGEHWREALLGLGQFLHTDWNPDMPREFARIDRLEASAREPLCEALGRAGLGPYYKPEKIRVQLTLAIPPEHRSAYLHGTGWRIQRAFRLRPDLAEAFIASCAPADQAELRAGWEAAKEIDTLR
jgi:hypothetical protein